jgi:hypothetical protein
MVDIKEPRDSLTDYLVFRYSPLLGLPIAAGLTWVGQSLLGIKDFGWLTLFVGLSTIATTAAVVFGLSTLAEPRSVGKKR